MKYEQARKGHKIQRRQRLTDVMNSDHVRRPSTSGAETLVADRALVGFDILVLLVHVALHPPKSGDFVVTADALVAILENDAVNSLLYRKRHAREVTNCTKNISRFSCTQIKINFQLRTYNWASF